MCYEKVLARGSVTIHKTGREKERYKTDLIRVGTADIPFTTCSRNIGFGFMISDSMTLDKHI